MTVTADPIHDRSLDRSLDTILDDLLGLQVRKVAEVGDVDTRQRIIVLRALPYDEESELVPRVFESFEPGACANAAKDPGRVKLWAVRHSTDGGPLVGHAIKIDDKPTGPEFQLRVARTRDGDDLLTLTEDGVLDEASSEFFPIREAMTLTRRADGLHVRHRRVQMRGVAVVPHGAYGRGAPVLAVRDDLRALIRDDHAEAMERRQSELAFLDALRH